NNPDDRDDGGRNGSKDRSGGVRPAGIHPRRKRKRVRVGGAVEPVRHPKERPSRNDKERRNEPQARSQSLPTPPRDMGAGPAPPPTKILHGRLRRRTLERRPDFPAHLATNVAAPLTDKPRSMPSRIRENPPGPGSKVSPFRIRPLPPFAPCPFPRECVTPETPATPAPQLAPVAHNNTRRALFEPL